MAKNGTLTYLEIGISDFAKKLPKGAAYGLWVVHHMYIVCTPGELVLLSGPKIHTFWAKMG
jgi:hypothetical protein